MADIDAVLKRIFLETFHLPEDEYSDALSYEDTPEWDSLGHMKMVAVLTTELQMDFDIGEVMAMESVGHIKKIIARKE